MLLKTKPPFFLTKHTPTHTYPLTHTHKLKKLDFSSSIPTKTQGFSHAIVPIDHPLPCNHLGKINYIPYHVFSHGVLMEFLGFMNSGQNLNPRG